MVLTMICDGATVKTVKPCDHRLEMNVKPVRRPSSPRTTIKLLQTWWHVVRRRSHDHHGWGDLPVCLLQEYANLNTYIKNAKSPVNCWDGCAWQNCIRGINTTVRTSLNSTLHVIESFCKNDEEKHGVRQGELKLRHKSNGDGVRLLANHLSPQMAVNDFWNVWTNSVCKPERLRTWTQLTRRYKWQWPIWTWRTHYLKLATLHANQFYSPTSNLIFTNPLPLL